MEVKLLEEYKNTSNFTSEAKSLVKAFLEDVNLILNNLDIKDKKWKIEEIFNRISVTDYFDKDDKIYNKKLIEILIFINNEAIKILDE